MNKQKGFSQIAVMIMMLVLAIALPITTRLVQKSQENRSKATLEYYYCTHDKLDTQCYENGPFWSEQECQSSLNGLLSWETEGSYCYTKGVAEPVNTLNDCEQKGGKCIDDSPRREFGSICTPTGETADSGKINNQWSCSNDNKSCCIPSVETYKLGKCADVNGYCTTNNGFNSGEPCATGGIANVRYSCDGANQICCVPTTTSGGSCTSTGGTCMDVVQNVGKYESGRTCTLDAGRVNGGTTNTSFSCGKASDICCVPISSADHPTGPTDVVYDFWNAVCVDNSDICSANYGTVVSGETSCGTDNCSGSEVCCIVDACKKNEGGICRYLLPAEKCPNNEVSHIGNGLCPVKGYTCCNPPYTDNPTNPTTTPVSTLDSCTGFVGMQKCIGGNKYVNCQIDTNNYYGNPTYNQAVWWNIDVHSCPTSPALFCTEGDIDGRVCKPITSNTIYTKGSCNTSTGKYSCTSSTSTSTANGSTTFSTQAACEDYTGCNATVCTENTTECVNQSQFRKCTNNNWVITDCNSSQLCTNDTGTCQTKVATDSVVNIKMAFAGVKANNGQCAVNWPTKLKMVDSNGQSVVDGIFNGVPRQTTSVNSKGDIVYTYGVTISNVPVTGGTKLAFFLTGLKHISLKYGRNNQTSWYSTFIGDISLNGGTTNNYDFSEYPLLAGDVTGDTDGVSDGKIDGRDFSYIKERSDSLDVATAGTNVTGDIDGNCQVNSGDVRLIKQSMREINGQTY